MKLDVGAAADAPVALEQRIAAVLARISEAARRAGRDAASVRMVAVTKGQPREAAAGAIAAGVTDIGENYVQEALPKYQGLAGVTKHFIGRVQTNKAKAIAAAFDVVQTIDSVDAGLAVLRAGRDRDRPISALIQVRIAGDKRFGAEPDDAVAIADQLRGAGLAVDGVMAVGPNTPDEAITRRAFEAAARAFERVGGSTLSLGMSNDLELAVACGSTMVRIGTAIFGERA
jgi:pyridoxal phosphate enzyme (YggS family)